MDAIEHGLLVLDFVEAKYPELRVFAQGLLMSQCFHILRQIKIKDKRQHRKEREYIISLVREYRKTVMCCGQVRKKTRGACALSYLGFWILVPFYRFATRL
jgi:hypothetical protein